MRKYLIYAFVTAGGAGFSPVAPGTAGSLVALLLAYWFHLSPLVLLGLTAMVLVAGIFASRYIEGVTGKEDPGLIVVDEVVGMWINLLWIPFEWKYLGLAFLLFRIFDIVKPWPAHQSQSLPHGIGVMMDDVIAGLYGLAALHILILFGI